MTREDIEKAKDIVKLIEENQKAVSELESCLCKNSKIFIGRMEYDCISGGMTFPKTVSFEDWEVRLMIHNKKQRIAALEKQLEQL